MTLEIISTIALVLIAVIMIVFWIPAILQIRKTAKAFEDFLKTTQENLNPLLAEIRESAEHINKTVERIEDSVKNVQRLTSAVGETGAMVDEVNNLIKRTGLSVTVKTASLGIGIKTALGVLAKGLIKNRDA